MPKQAGLRKKLTRQEQRDLDIEIGFIEGVVRRDPGYVEALQILGDGYTRRGRYSDGLKVDEQLVRLLPDDATAQYNLGCSYVLTDQLEAAAEAIEQAIDLGYSDFKWISRDPDLATLRKHPLYRKIREKIRAVKMDLA